MQPRVTMHAPPGLQTASSKRSDRKYRTCMKRAFDDVYLERVHSLEHRLQLLESRVAGCPTCGRDIVATCVAQASDLDETFSGDEELCSSSFSSADVPSPVRHEEFFIGECSIGVQTELTTSPSDDLVYASDPSVLLQAIVNNSALDLQNNLRACEAHVALLLGPDEPWVFDNDVNDERVEASLPMSEVDSDDLILTDTLFFKVLL